MKAIEINTTGKKKECEISRKDLIAQFSIHTRDLRPIFSQRQMATISPRGKGIVVNLRSLKFIVSARKVIFLSPENKKETEAFIPILIEHLESRDKSLLFEHLVLEQALSFVIARLGTEYARVTNHCDQMLSRLKKQLHDENFEKLLKLKKNLLRLLGTTKEIHEIIADILDDDEEIKDLYLSRKAPADPEDVESILENLLEQIDDIMNHIDELNENIDDTQEILNLKMANRRNEIIKFDLYLTAITVIFSFMAVVVGLFGMNILNTLESNHTAFWGIILLLTLCFFGFWAIIRWYLKKRIIG